MHRWINGPVQWVGGTRHRKKPGSGYPDPGFPLNTSLSTVQKWEIGQKRPTGTVLKLLHWVQKRGLEGVA